MLMYFLFCAPTVVPDLLIEGEVIIVQTDIEYQHLLSKNIFYSRTLGCTSAESVFSVTTL